MKYFIGGFVTFISLLIINRLSILILKNINKKNTNIFYRQSHIHKMISNFIIQEKQNKVSPLTQSIKRNRENTIKVIIIDDAAYWIKDNTFYTAVVDEYGVVDKETTRIVDTMTMNSVELDKMLFIMDKLREGLDNDSGSTGQ